jgi:diacylglycerol kinase (ATP)
VVALGGDGTMLAALQAVAEHPVALGIIPAGTGNDFAMAVGVPADPVVAARAAAADLRAGGLRRVDLARIEAAGRHPVWLGAVLAAGFDAIVNERANRMTFPRGPRRYDLAMLVELLGLRARRYRLRLDGVASEVDAVLVAVGNTASYGGGMRICPDADPCDGLLDVVIGGRLSRAALIGLSAKVYRGEHVGHRLVSVTRARVVELASDGITVYADGERVHPLPVTVTCVPGALRLLGAP